MTILIRRFQQGNSQALQAANRSGGVAGSGTNFANMGMLGHIAFGAVAGIVAPATPTVVTGSTVSFVLSRPGTILVQGTINAGSNCAAGLFNLVALNGSAGLTLLDTGGVWPYALAQGIGAGTINYLPITLFAVAFGQPGTYTVNWQVNAATNGSVTVNNGHLDVFTSTS